jgi:hypothetical protein
MVHFMSVSIILCTTIQKIPRNLLSKSRVHSGIEVLIGYAILLLKNLVQIFLILRRMYSGKPGKESFEECPGGCLPGFSNIANFMYPGRVGIRNG